MTAESVATGAYLVAALLFILSLAGLSKHDTARRGVLFGIVGMAIALVATFWLAATAGWGSAATMTGLVVLIVATIVVILADLDELAELFSGYLDFYRMPRPAAEIARFLEARLRNDESAVFIARVVMPPCQAPRAMLAAPHGP